MMSRNLFIIAVVGVLFFCLMATIIGFVIDAPHLVLLVHEHAETSGEVTRLLPETHGLVEVRYSAAGATYQRAFVPHLQTHLVAEGDSVRVYYLPRDPTIASIAPPAEILSEELPAWVTFSLLMSVGIAVAVLTLWSPTAPFHNISVRVTSPKVMSAGITLGVVSGFLISIYTGTLNIPKLVGGVFVMSGCAVFLQSAWGRKRSWPELLRSKQFWIAFALAIAGNILNDML